MSMTKTFTTYLTDEFFLKVAPASIIISLTEAPVLPHIIFYTVAEYLFLLGQKS